MNKQQLLKIVSEQSEHIEQLEYEITVLNQKINSYEQFIAENRSLRSEHIVAEQIQRSMLPTAYPAFQEFTNIDLYADMDTACEVGGDFYDYFPIDDNHICFGICDVEGKGIPAAMYMAIAKSMIKLRIQAGETLGTVFTDINRLFCTSTMQKRFITSWMAIMEVSTGKLTCINAGHNYPILKRKDGTAEFITNKSGLPIASFFSKRHPNTYNEFEVTIEKRDVLLLYTDGVTEAQNRNGKFYGDERLKEAIDLYMSDKHTMKELVAYIRRQVIAFANHADQDDDITLLALSITEQS